MRTPAPALLLVFVAAVLGCGGGSKASPPTTDVTVDPPPQPSAHEGAGPQCGFVFYGSDYDPSCQRALDAECCGQEKACAADASCTKLIACVNACPSPRTDACIGACTGRSDNPPGYEKVDAIASCSKRSRMKPGACDWPVGSGH